MIITANELKIKGVNILSDNVIQNNTAVITVHGKKKYMILDVAYYEYLQECELERAINDSKNDIQNGDFKEMTAKEHINQLKNEL